MVRRRSTGATSCSPTDCPARGSPRLGRPPASLRGRFHRNLHPASTCQNSATTRQTDKTGKRAISHSTLWRVITNPTNLYRQTDFPKAERALTFHLRLGIYITERSPYRSRWFALSHSFPFPDPSSASSSKHRLTNLIIRQSQTRQSTCFSQPEPQEGSGPGPGPEPSWQVSGGGLC